MSAANVQRGSGECSHSFLHVHGAMCHLMRDPVVASRYFGVDIVGDATIEMRRVAGAGVHGFEVFYAFIFHSQQRIGWNFKGDKQMPRAVNEYERSNDLRKWDI